MPKASSAASPFVAEPGPAFDAAAAADQPPPAPAPELEPQAGALDWQEEDVRTLLEAQGVVVHSVIGVGDSDWLYTAAELKAIAGPLTRILNHYPATRAAAAAGPQAGLALGLSGYVIRSARERREVLRALEEAEPEPVSGVHAPAGTGPPEEPAPAPADTIETEGQWSKLG